MKKLVILGGGFAGLWAAMSAEHERRKWAAEVSITLVSRDPALTIRPRLYEGALDEMQVPLRPLLNRLGVNFELAEIEGLDPAAGRVNLGGKRWLDFDRAVLATGSRMRALPVPGAAEHAHSIDTFAESRTLDARLAGLGARAEIVVVGAGLTGLELATELRTRLGEGAGITLVDAKDNPTGAMSEPLATLIAEALAASRIKTKFGQRIREIARDGAVLEGGERIPADAVVLTVGLEASPLVRSLGGERDDLGRVRSDPDLRVATAPNVFAAGDTVHALTDGQHPAQMTCQHALVLGRYAGCNAMRDLAGQPTRPYRQDVYVTCLDLGPWGAVFTRGWDREVELTGAEGKDRKQLINRSRIYPPSPDIGADDILKSIALPDATSPQ